jgi:hypothetical protein
MLLSFTRVTLRLLALLGQVTWTGTVWGRWLGRLFLFGLKLLYSEGCLTKDGWENRMLEVTGKDGKG